MSACGSCGAQIRWVLTEAGERMPIDPLPTDDGNIVPVGGSSQAEPRAHTLHKGERPPEGVPRFMPHWATCPSADQHRKAATSNNRPAEGGD